MKDRKCNDLEKQIQNLCLEMSNSKVENNNRMEIQSHYVTRMDIGDQANN